MTGFELFARQLFVRELIRSARKGKTLLPCRKKKYSS
jgi:hypothetical protein